MTSASSAAGGDRAASPVLFMVFNRPRETAETFARIRAARPRRLYVAADGPRAHKAGEVEACTATRKVATQVDWDCEVAILFREENLGCKIAVSGAIDWFFEHESQGIILEDDCLPSPSFFPFCDELLARYAADERIGQISGSSFFADEVQLDGPESYIYSRYGSIWGWATWRRAWQHYDRDLIEWPEMKLRQNIISAIPSYRERRHKKSLGEKLHAGVIDTWDYQWGFAKAYQNQLSIVPKKNLILNIGFGVEATHTKWKDSKVPLKLHDLNFPLIAPRFLIPHGQYDAVFAKRAYPIGPYYKARSFLSWVIRYFRIDQWFRF